ncbi:MAG: hypothetical protein E7292_03825 [Lachnospiraceae bacterium]|nr:hypothetical protein [Lachnospiraceae bacterium]
MKKTSIFLAVMAVIAAVCVVGIRFGSKEVSGVAESFGGEPKLLTESGFYEAETQVRITVPKGAKVYYTTNCEEPTLENGQLYDGPVVLSAPEAGEQAYVLRFKAYFEDGTWSDTLTGTYFVGQGIANRYTTKVLSIVGEPEALFGYEEGILVPGKRYDEFMEANPGIHPGNGVEANYTMRGDAAEREVYLELFDQDGQEIFSQKGGVRVAGQLSRLNNHKSLRLYARREYDEENNKFRFDLFENITSKADGTMGQEYKRLLLKNSGQDYGYAFLRTELIGRLADQAGFGDVQHVTPVCVYINGEYYGSYWLANHFDGQYFENRYGAYDGEFVVLEHADMKKYVSEESSELEVSSTAEYNAQYDKFAAMDLTVDANYKALQKFMDVENYLEYFAIENYVANDDWPDSNLKTFRYEAGESGYTEGTVFDGRYRMLLYDADYGFGLMFYHDTIGTLVNELTLDKIMYDRSPLFAALMKREDCRQYFVSYTLDLMNGAMSAENVAEQVDEMHFSRVQELVRTLEVEGLVGGLLLEPDAMNMATVDRNLQQIRSFAEERPVYVLQDFEEKFDYHQKYQLTVADESLYSCVKVNGIYCEENEFMGTYLKEVPVTLTPCLGPNEHFSYWLVNGEMRMEEELMLVGEQIPGETVEVELVTAETEEPRLQIVAVATRGQDDYVELMNCSAKPVGTSGYYLTDSDEPWKYQLPALVLEPGEVLRLVGKSNSSAESLGQYGLNFNLRTGELLQLNFKNQLTDSVEIPQLSEDGVYTRDFIRGTYTEQKREQSVE